MKNCFVSQAGSKRGGREAGELEAEDQP